MEGVVHDSSSIHSLAYLDDHVGFCGTIKSSPSDFVVTEIDMSGQLVRESVINSFFKFGELPEKQNSSCQYKKQKIVPQESYLEKRHFLNFREFVNRTDPPEQDMAVDTNTMEEVDDEYGPEKTDNLSSLLEEPLLESLTAFACSIKSELSSEMQSATPPLEFSLGSFPDKDQRARFHSAIQQTYPFLLTATRSTEIIVKPNLDYRELCQLVSEEEAENFLKYLDSKQVNSTFTFKPDLSKEHRKAVHHFISKKFGKLVETKSFSKEDHQGQQNTVITARFREKSGSLKKRRRADCQDVSDIYTAFTLRKENLETLEAISCLSSELGVLPSDFSYAGVKDKKAITYQTVVVKKVTPMRLKEVESRIQKKGMTMYNIRSVQQHLRLGQLKGNQFDIIVRDLKTQHGDSEATIEKIIFQATENVKKNGFVNYYGPQRFGRGKHVQSNQIGLALLKEDMVKAVKLLFTPEEEDNPVNRAKRYFLQTEDAKITLALMPECKVRERMVLRALNRYSISPEGCTRAWFSIPHSMRIFYVHAHCSKVWNEAASYRLKTYGSQVVEGDLVIRETDDVETTSLTDRVHVVTALEEASKAYALHQVVLPMIGHSVTYPGNKVGEWYHEMLGRDGLQACTFRNSVLQLNVPGCYRHILKYPRNLLYEVIEELDDGVESKEDTKEWNAALSSKQSLKISFELDSSCYATVCLREIMKYDC
uniref:Pseudouridylate synthase PUS7L n=1 Tax=Geotrypetes seraphini TaxID=260995 RepID=A0A6P8SB13_GEOSA|nr:pseudouridylate synthase 7 homolog-like protein [Geotrypetes seraphini]XP_033815316.1 pseudouridylate synthase 7 homolog-like protein [Geotrypetes seraphini]XP_033815317.1 pseudouridylate synthase 7 homolog-like protein [Geotrypetes seraphini]